MSVFAVSLLTSALALAGGLLLPDEDGTPGSPAARGFRVETRSGEDLEGELLGGHDGALRLSVDGEEREVAAGAWVLAWNLSPGEAQADDPQDLLLLASADGPTGSGDRLWGRLLGGDEFGLRVRLDAGIEIEVPFDVVDRFLPDVDRPLDSLIDLAGGGFDDRLWRRRLDGGLDGVTGVLARLEQRTIILESPLGELNFPVENVLALVLAATEHPGNVLEGWPVTVRLVGGSLFEAALKEVSGGVFFFDTQFAQPLAVPQDVVASLLPRGGDGEATPLASYEPVGVEEWPALGGPEALLFPWRRGLSVSGQPLRVGGLLRATGIGVHANARLQYVVPEGATGLRVTVGLVDEVFELPAEASVTFEILVDGQSMVSTGIFREGDAPVDLRVTGLEEGQILELVTLDAGDLDAGDRAAWVDGLFFSGG